jgi:hypothetical protein
VHLQAREYNSGQSSWQPAPSGRHGTAKAGSNRPVQQSIFLVFIRIFLMETI